MRLETLEALRWVVRPMSREDVVSVARLHLTAFPGYFTSQLGEKFLSIYYGYLARSGNGIGLTCECESDSRMVGFITGVINPRQFYKEFLKEEGAKIALAIVPKMTTRPSMALKLLKGLLYPSKSPGGEENAVITSIAVLPEWQRGGLGSLLLERFQQEAVARGITYVITGAKRHETKVIAFYERDGFLIDRAEQNPGYGDSVLLTKTLSSHEKASLG